MRLRRNNEGLAVMVSIRDSTAWVVFTFFAKALWDILRFNLFSISFFASKYSGSDSSQVFLNFEYLLYPSFNLFFRSEV